MASTLFNAALAILPALALAAPSPRPEASSSDSSPDVDLCAPSVDLNNGTYFGVSNEHYQQDFFLGIPYAQPPTGPLRFAPPQALDEAWDEPRDATSYGNICFGYGADTAALRNPISEDCLTLNIVRPAGVEAGDDLPVSIWVHGGSYVNGASADPRYNLSYIVDQSVKEEKPIIAVSINYRLAQWGFLFSNEMQAAGAGNIAFRDQRLAFQWIQDNVAAFGGNTDQVTVWGESAGARSLGMQLVAYDGKHDNLFHKAILESGSPVTKFLDADAWQPYFDSLVANTGCAGAADHLTCLRELPAQTLNDAFNGTTPLNVTTPIYSAVIDGDFMTAQATELLKEGKFAHVPLLLGNNFDEGTAYGKKNLNTSDQFEQYLTGLDLSDGTVSEIASLYPDDPEAGIPASLIGRPDASSGYGLQWKRAAAFAGDWQQHAGRRLLAESYAEADIPVYSYRWNVYVNGIGPILGATHFQEVAFVFYDLESPEFQNKPETFKQLSNLMSRQWVNFMHDTNPNLSQASANSTEWPLYTPSAPDNIVFDVNSTGLAYTEVDNYREAAITYLQQNVYNQGRAR